MNNPGDDPYSRQQSREFMMMTEQATGGCQLKADSNMESGEDSNDEIQRYMHGRGCSKRHTVGCTDDLSVAPSGQCMEPPLAHSPIPSTSGMSQSGSSGRTRRTGLLTVMERPPGKRIGLLPFLTPFLHGFSMETLCIDSLFSFYFYFIPELL
jgi:hypothetical protein